jgi:glycosyltransferase involved in cell wall biosynthesis
VKIVGEGPERPHLEALVDALELGDRIAFEGHVPESALEQVLADAVGVIVPSLAGEVFGLVAAEQMMRGRLVIAADTGGLGEVVGDAGLRFAVGDARDLAERMREALEAPGAMIEFQQRARQRATSFFGEERMLAEHVAVYERVLNFR